VLAEPDELEEELGVAARLLESSSYPYPSS
jgi:hypothetical protein